MYSVYIKQLTDELIAIHERMGCSELNVTSGTIRQRTKEHQYRTAKDAVIFLIRLKLKYS
jgi:hypothetical protein